MSEAVSARPELLGNFATSQSTAASTLDTQRIDDSSSFFSFISADGTGACDQACVDVINTHAANLVYELNEIALFVNIVNEALKLADNADPDGVLRFNGDLQPYLDAVAGAYGVSFTDMALSDVVTKDDIGPLNVGTVPENSGFVNDPVCTATGHLLIDARDFVMPPRPDVLTFRRTYASRDLNDGGFGPGWWSWTECRSELLPNGSFVFHGPDAMEFSVEPFGDGTFVGRPELDVQVAQTGDDRFDLRWGRRSRYPYQRWTFVSGRLGEVTGPFHGTTTFVHGAQGLARIEHDSGRSLSLRWSRRRVVALESSDGRVARFSYDRKGRLVGVDNAISPETYEVDDEGRILSITDADGVRTVAMTYDEAGRVVDQVTAAGFVTRFGYDQPRRTTLADRDHNPLSVYTHDEHGRVEMYATGGGFRFTRRFDSLGRVVSQRDPDGTSFTLNEAFEGVLRVEEFAWSTGATDRYLYDHLDRLVSQSSPDKMTTFEYDDGTVFPSRIVVEGDEGITVALHWENGAPVRIEDGDGVVDSYDVRPDGTIAAVTNAYGATTRYDQHPSGAVARISYADGRAVHHDRDDAGRLIAVVDAAGGRGDLRYTTAGRLTSVTDAAGSVTTLEYDSAGAPTRVVAADGAATDFMFDDQQRPIGVRFANGDTIGLTLDEFGRQVALDVAGAHWVTERDNAGRIVKRVDPTGRQSIQTYGELVQWSEITDAAAATSRLEIDLARRVTSLQTREGDVEATYAATGLVRNETAPDGTTREYAYTSGGRLTKVVEQSNTVECRYDEAGQLVATNTGTGWWTFDRDLYGRITRRVSPAGREQRYEYDVLGNVTAIEVEHAVWRFAYDPLGRVVSSTDPTGRTKSFAYDAMGRMVESRDGRAVPLRYEYDPRGRIAAMVDSGGGAVRYEHNPTGQLTSVVDQIGRQTVVRYDAAGRHVGTEYLDRDGSPMVPDALAGLAQPDDLRIDCDGVALAREDSADGSITRWTLPSGDHVDLQRDADGMAILLTSPGFAREFVRDACGRVIAVNDSVDGATSTTTLRRDLAGRVVEQVVDGVITTYAYDDAGQLTSVDSPDGVSTWDYDDAGRLVRERGANGERRFEYDVAHQLVKLVEGDDVTTFEYDARGRRVRARGRHDVAYVWGRDRLEAVVTDGRTTSLSFDDSYRLARFGEHDVRWSDGGELAQPTSVDGNAVISLGASTFGAVDHYGVVAWRPFSAADAWGDTTEGDSFDSAWHPYFGVAVDGIVWLGVRPYDIATRQFLAPDPLAPVPGGAGVTSPYTYAYNDPINFIDPTGRQGQPISREDFADVVDRHTGVQWGNVAAVGIAVVATVAVVVVTAGAAAPLALSTYALIGAGTGLATGLAREGLEAATHTGDGTFDGGPIVRDTLIGFAGGFLGGVGGRVVAPLASRLAGATGLPTRVATGGATFLTEGAAGAGEATVGEAYDVAVPAGMRTYLGGDGSFDAGQIPVNAGINAVVGTAADEIVPRIPGIGDGPNVPTNAGADPSNTPVNVSPAPDLPASAPTAGGGDSAPAAGGDPTPAASADPPPSSASGDPAPAATADPPPSSAGADPAPASATGDSAPSSAGADPAPASATGDPAPAASSDPAPASAADPTSTTSGGDPAPVSAGDRAPATAGADPAPASAADPAPTGAADPVPARAAADPSASAAGTDAAPAGAADPAPAGAADPAPVRAAADPAPASAAADPAPVRAGGDPAPSLNGDPTPRAAGDPASVGVDPSPRGATDDPTTTAESPMSPAAGASESSDSGVELPAGTPEAGATALAVRPLAAATVDTPAPVASKPDSGHIPSAGDPTPTGGGDAPSTGNGEAPLDGPTASTDGPAASGDGGPPHAEAPRSYANAKGEAGEAYVRDQLQTNSLDIAGEHVRIRTNDGSVTEVDFVVRGGVGGSEVRVTDAHGNTVVDVVVAEGELRGIEVKNGPTARETDAQRDGFPQVRDSGGTVDGVYAGGSLSVGDELGPMEIDLARIDVEPDGPTYTADAKGKVGEAHVVDQLRPSNLEVAGQHVRITTADGGTTEIDVVVRGGSGGAQVSIAEADGQVVVELTVAEGELVGIEVKNGPDAVPSEAQRVRFPQVRDSGGTVNRVDEGGTLVVGDRLTGFNIHIVRINVPVATP